MTSPDGLHESRALLNRYFQLGSEYTTKQIIPPKKPDYLERVHDLLPFAPAIFYSKGDLSKARAEYATSRSRSNGTYSSGLSNLLGLESKPLSYGSRSPYDISIN